MRQMRGVHPYNTHNRIIYRLSETTIADVWGDEVSENGKPSVGVYFETITSDEDDICYYDEDGRGWTIVDQQYVVLNVPWERFLANPDVYLLRARL